MAVRKIVAPRSPKYATRLREACDAHPSCPPLHEGRLTWLQHQLRQRNIQVSIESVRKWLAGEGRPKEDKSDALAAALGVDPTWLYVGRKALPETLIEAAPAPGRSDTEEWLPVAIRPGVTIRIFGLPHDLAQAEAQKIANIVLAHAVSSEP